MCFEGGISLEGSSNISNLPRNTPSVLSSTSLYEACRLVSWLTGLSDLSPSQLSPVDMIFHSPLTVAGAAAD